MKLTDLPREDRLRLLRFACSFAWADLEMADSERGLVKKLIGRLALDPAETTEMEAYLTVPPEPEEVDPTEIPAAHRQLFLDTVLQMIGADGHVSEAEMETLSLFEKLLPP